MREVAGSLPFALCVLFVSPIFGCRQIVGIEHRELGPDAGSDAGPAACGDLPTPGVPDCNACSEANCCAQGESCTNGPVCSNEYSCLGACRPDTSGSLGVESCRALCASEPNSATDLLTACRAKNCGTKCGLECGGMFGAYLNRLVNRSYGCRDCLAQSCAQGTACGESATCLSAVACQENCSPFDLACINSCQALDPPGADGGASPSQALYASISNTCTGSAQCAFGAQWGCIGKVSWPVAAAAGPVRFTVQVLDSATPMPLPGFTVKACGHNDGTCASPIDTQVTDQNGIAIISVTLAAQLGWDGYVEVSGPQYVTTLSFPVLVLTGGDLVPYIRVTMASVTLLNNIVTGNGATWDPTRGIVLAFARDCELKSAPNVTFQANPESIDSETIPFYDVNGVPSRQATETQLDPTGAAGGWLNIKAGTVNVTATVKTIGTVYSSSTIFVRPQVLTIVRAVPTPNL